MKATVKTDVERRQLAMDIMNGKVFGSWQLNTENIFSVFLPLVFMGIDESVGHVYEYLDKAGPREVNGCPCFTTVKVLHKDDVPPILAYMEELDAANKAFLN